MDELTLQQARALHLAAQGLLQPPVNASTPASLCASISRMGLLQIDTIHVVARSPYLVLFSRLGHYPPGWLDEALATGQVFETWAHEACLAPMADWVHHRSYNREARQHWGLASARQSHLHQRVQLDALLDHIRQTGAVKSSDFERQGAQGSAWWGWKDEKRWLEALFASGEVMVSRREKFQRVYDLTERVAPQQVALQCVNQPLALAGVTKAFIEKSIAAMGITQARWVNDYFRMKPRLKDADLAVMVEAGTLKKVKVEAWQSPAYVHVSQLAMLDLALAGQLQAGHTTLLSPFDPVVWDRERVAALFDFDYRLECYTPEAKRVYGYFVLPILCCGQLIGRLDAKAHRSKKRFEVKSLFAQPGSDWNAAQVQAVAVALVRCAYWHGTPEVTIERTQPGKLAGALRRAINAIRKESFQK